jgi:hypothetical protein
MAVPLGDMTLAVWCLRVCLDDFFEEGVMLPEQREEVMAGVKKVLQPNDLYERIDLGVCLLDRLVNGMESVLCASHFNAHARLPGHLFQVVSWRVPPYLGFLTGEHECAFVVSSTCSGSRGSQDDSFNDSWIVRAVNPKFILHMFSRFWRPFFPVPHHLYITIP